MRFMYSFLSALLFLPLAGCGGANGDGGEPPPPAIAVTISPTAATLAAGESQQFACVVTGSSNSACTWSVPESGSGTVSATGLYTAPLAAGTYQLVARSDANPGRSATAAITVTTPPATTPWVTGYYLGYFWDWMYPPQAVDMTAMTHFVFARAAPGGGTLGGQPGDVMPGAGTAHQPRLSPDGVSSVEDYLVARAKAAGVKTLLMIGGVGDGDGFIHSSSDAVRPRFVGNLVDYLVAHDYDGVDLDWEDRFQGSSDGEVGGDEVKRRARALIADLRVEAATRARYQGAGRAMLITFPGYGVSVNEQAPGGRAQQWQADIANAVDQYNLMSYGIGSAYNAYGWHSWFSSPIHGATLNTPYSLEASVAAYERAGVPASKIGIGIGFFGIYYGPCVTGPRQSLACNPRFEVQDTPLRYSELVRHGFLSHGAYHWDTVAEVGYRSYPGGFQPGGGLAAAGFLSFENPESIAAKARYVRNRKLGGAIIWAINYDHMPDGSSPLLSATRQHFLGR